MGENAKDSRLRLLVIDDDDLIASSIRIILPAQWRMVHFTGKGELPTGPFEGALVDMHLSQNVSRAEGVEFIQLLHKLDPHLEIVAMSGNLDRALMESCLKAGSTRFLAKPLSPDEFLLTLEKIEALHLLREASSRSGSNTVPWIGSSAKSEDTRRAIASLRGERGPILIEGESGTGKEVAAQLIYSQERDAGARPFVSVNLAALPEAVFESEFFGHVRGAFTGADQNKMGLAEAAHGGDLFLDEVEAFPISQQAKLLRFLESGEVRRVGARDTIQVKVRIIAATNRNLEQMVKDGKFREDLLWRLNGRKLLLPPLRERPTDIQELTGFFLDRERPKRNKTLLPDAIETLMQHSWSGNVRELRRVVELLGLYSPLPIIRREDVLRVLPTSTSIVAGHAEFDLSRGLNTILGEIEAEIIRQGLAKKSDVDEAAALLGISRSSLYKKMKDYNIESRGSS
jgi:DNA-binding NtrC family response regulator